MWTHEETIETSAAPARVWELFADVARWKEWNAGIETIQIHGPFKEGTTFTMQPPGQDAIKSTLVEVKPNESFTDETVVDETRVLVRHQLAPFSSGATKIIYSTEITGPGAAEVGAMVTSDFADVLASLKRLAEQPRPNDELDRVHKAIETRIRPCTRDDEAALALVGQATFLETFAGVLGGKDIVAHCAHVHSAEHYRAWLLDPTYALWIVESNPGDAPVGYMVVAPPQLPIPDTAGDMELKRIYLLGKYQGVGLGKLLLQIAVEHSVAAGAKRLLLGVYAQNKPATSFYERIGFSKLGDRKFNVGGKDYADNIMGMSLNSQFESKQLRARL